MGTKLLPAEAWVQGANLPRRSDEGDKGSESSGMRTNTMHSPEELGRQEGTFINQKRSSAHSRGDVLACEG